MIILNSLPSDIAQDKKKICEKKKEEWKATMIHRILTEINKVSPT